MKQTSKLSLVFLAVFLSGCVTSQTTSFESSDEDAARVNATLGWRYMQQGNYDLAMEKLQKALSQDSNSKDAHNAIALLYDRLGDNKAADKHYRLALKNSANDPVVLNLYGVFLCRHERFSEAEEKFLIAAKNRTYRTPEAAYANAGVCARSIPDLEKAEGFFRESLRLNTRYQQALWQMADLSFEKQRYLQSRAFLQRFMTQSKPTAEALWLGVRVERALGQNELADEYAQTLKRDFPTSLETRKLLEVEDGQTDGPTDG